MNAEVQYLALIKKILDCGYHKDDRTGVGCKCLFGESIRHDFSEGFPLITTKKIHVKSVLHELLWFLKGTEDVAYLLDNDVTIWDEWMVERNGKLVLPHTYGVKWRNFNGVDQIKDLIEGISKYPDSRRHIVSVIDPAAKDEVALFWCHVLFQLDIEDKYISMSVYSRSVDMFLGAPFNIASYSFLLYMIAKVTGYEPKSLYYTFGNAHIYDNHIDQCMLLLQREPHALPKLEVAGRENIDDFIFGDFKIINYVSHPGIKAPVAV